MRSRLAIHPRESGLPEAVIMIAGADLTDILVQHRTASSEELDEWIKAEAV
jgi:hypothetical protein